MTTAIDATILSFAATSPAWPAMPSLATINLGRDISIEVLAIEANQNRLRALLPGQQATANELEELETISGELKLCVQRFEAFLVRWDGEVLDLGLEEGEVLEGEEDEEMEEDDDSLSPPPPPPPHGHIPRPIVRIDPNTISVGDIGWAPLPRMAATSRPWFVPSEYGQICIKVYPFIIVKKMEDCMVGVVISTSRGNGLANKTASLRARSTYVVGANFRGYSDVSYGEGMGPKGMNLEVDQTQAYEPRPGAFMDMLDTYQIPYNTRWKPEGRLTYTSRVDLGRMRYAVLKKDTLGRRVWEW
ncbi:hypothetical protein J4E91_010058 [Alternaria rosae]|nr:hypothetical protein J4E91_010058 [Alternaria rosae]